MEQTENLGGARAPGAPPPPPPPPPPPRFLRLLDTTWNSSTWTDFYKTINILSVTFPTLHLPIPQTHPLCLPK